MSRQPKTITLEPEEIALAEKNMKKRYQVNLSYYISFLIRKDNEQLEQEAKK